MLNAGESFADLSSWRKIELSGSDAVRWLDSLASADLAGLVPGRARRSLLLSPTGQVRAEFTVAMRDGYLLLIQDPRQPHPLDRLLWPYVLSSDVRFEDRTTALGLYALPKRDVAPNAPGAEWSSPSVLGPGLDGIAAMEHHGRILRSLQQELALATADDLEAWRIAAAVPRLGADVFDEDLPQEAGLQEAVAFDKGCYLGQESVARVRNLGHPRRSLLSLAAGAGVAVGDAVVVGGREAGRVTSAATLDGRVFLLARVRWADREGPFTTPSGIALSLRPPA